MARHAAGYRHGIRRIARQAVSAMKMLRKLLLWLVIAPIAIVLTVQLYFFVQIWWWVDHNPESTSFMDRQLSVLREKDPKAQIKHKWVPYQRISNNLKRAIIAAEDSHFSEHEGIDWDAMQRAYEKNTRKGKVVAGGSTITQQLAKNLFLSGERSYLRKGQEVVITYMLEFLMDKERIFEIYLNVVEWGVGVFGAEAAAQHYYGVSAASLNTAQAARLAVMLPKPRFYDKNRGSSYLMRRTDLILRRMGGAELP
jgi:monofunctional glycosyltransferase